MHRVCYRQIPALFTESELVQAKGDPPVRRLASLAAALAGIEPIFVAISSAMRFTVDDPQMAVQWERLSRALDQIAVEIRTASPTAIFSPHGRFDPGLAGRVTGGDYRLLAATPNRVTATTFR